MARNKKKAQSTILNEIKNQLLLQAERWDNYGYSPIKIEEMLKDQCDKIKGDLLAEKNNLEYELNYLGTDKREVLIKIERLESYLKKANKAMEKHDRTIRRMVDKLIGDIKAVNRAKGLIDSKSQISVMLGVN
ncbi:MAG: hypothetical protein WC624_04985 [Candidatus Margulisiibacteriota bacterium]